jgi:hypothetical protein
MLGEPPRGVETGLLDHVRRVDPPLQPPIQVQGHHAEQAVPIPREQPLPGGLIPLRGSRDELVRLAIALWLAHGRHHTDVTGRRVVLGTGAAERP